MRYRRRTDENQREIMQALRTLGFCVFDLSNVGRGCPDLLVGRKGRIWLIEVKNTAGRNRIGEAQAAFAIDWPVTVIRTVADVQAWVDGVAGCEAVMEAAE